MKVTHASECCHLLSSPTLSPPFLSFALPFTVLIFFPFLFLPFLTFPYPFSPFSSPVIPTFSSPHTACWLAITLAETAPSAKQHRGSWQGRGAHSGEASTSLHHYHWAGRTQGERGALDPDNMSLSHAHTLNLLPSNCHLVTHPEHNIIKRMTDKVSTDGWSLHLQ